MMKSESVRRLLVATPDRRLVVIISMDDLLDALAGEMAGIVQAIRGGFAREAAAIRSTCVLCGRALGTDADALTRCVAWMASDSAARAPKEPARSVGSASSRVRQNGA